MTERSGISKKAAESAVFETAYSRIFLSMSCLLAPALAFFAFDKLGLAPTRRLFKTPYEIGIFVAALCLFLPASVAIFPQTGKIAVNQVDNAENLVNINSNSEFLYYNKGL